MRAKHHLWRNGLLVVLLSLFVLGIVKPVSADMGPKPSMQFSIEYDMETEPTIKSVILYQCDNPDCRNAAPLEELGPQGIYCDEDNCYALAYGFEDYFRLELTFDDGVTRQSNIFTKTRFTALYTVTVRDTDLDVATTGGLANPLDVFLSAAIATLLFIIAAIVLGIMASRVKDKDLVFKQMPGAFITIWILGALGMLSGTITSITLPLTFILEASILVGYAINRKEPIPTWIMLAFGVNLITQPLLIMAMLFSGGGGEYFWVLIIAELLIFAAEMGILRLIKREDESFGWLQAAIISLILNAASFAVGLFLPV